MFTSPLDLRQNISWYRDNFPLEYQELLHDWCLKFNYSLFGGVVILSKDIHIFSYTQSIDIYQEYGYKISFIHGSNYIDLDSKDSFYYSTPKIYSSTEKTWMKPLTLPSIQNMLGITSFSEIEIKFANRSWKPPQNSQQIFSPNILTFIN